MKIVHVIAQLPSNTGSGVFFTSMIEGFKRFGYEQKAVFACQDEYRWQTLPESDQYPVTFKTDALPFPVAGMSDVMPYENTVYSAMTDEMLNRWKEEFVKALRQVKVEFIPEVIFAHHLWILTSLVADIFPEAKIIGICHNTDLRQAHMNPHLHQAHVKNIGKLDLIFSNSENQKDDIVKLYQYDINKIVAVGGGFNQNIFYPPEQKNYSDTVKLVYCAKIDPSKGIFELVEAYKSLALPDVTLDIIGSPNEENRQRLLDFIDGDKTISVYNAKDQQQLGEILRQKDIFLMPSYYEGLGLMAVESLACGLFVVATEIEALQHFLGDNINASGIISYVPMPRIFDTDKPVAEDLPEFKANLQKAMLTQIEKVRKRTAIPEEIMAGIRERSWDGLINRMNDMIVDSGI